jgi:hypothetical protein
VGQQLNSQGEDYIKEAMDAKAERDADDAKVEKPLADQMVRQGYLREKGAVDPMVERAVDHTKVTASMKEASELTGHKQQVRSCLAAIFSPEFCGRGLLHAKSCSCK